MAVLVNVITAYVLDHMANSKGKVAKYWQAAKDLNNKDLQAKAKYAYEHRGDTMITLIDGLAIVCAILILIGIVWCFVWIISQR